MFTNLRSYLPIAVSRIALGDNAISEGDDRVPTYFVRLANSHLVKNRRQHQT